jgi:hypothetical protein
MRIRRIEVKDFRKLGHALVDDLQDGLNVIVGDNETGKSTLLAALRTGLFERHRVGGEVAAAMLPYGQSVRPEISVDFELEGQSWTLRKAFCQRPEAELKGPGERTTGDAVEERLAELFGFTPPGRGGSKPDEHQGVQGLLWVEQGRSHRALGVGGGRDAITSALEQEVGQVVGGERGRALLVSAEERRQEFWDKRGNPRGAFKALAETTETLQTRHRDLTAALAAHDGKVADLGTTVDALARHEREGRLDAAIRSLAAARDGVVHAERLKATLAATREVCARRDNDLDGARARKHARATLMGEAARAHAGAVATAAELADERAELTRMESSLAEADRVLRETRACTAAAADGLRRLDLAHSQAEARDRLVTLEAHAASAHEADALRRDRLAVASSIRLDAAALKALDALQGEHDRALLQLEAASVRITFEPEGDKAIAIDGEGYAPGAPLRLSRDAILTLEGFGRIAIRPGGGVDSLRLKVEAAARALSARLADLGFATLGTAQAALATKTDAQREAEMAGRTLAALAPHGLEALLQAIADQRARLATGIEASLDWSEAKRNEATRMLDRARSAEGTAEAGVASRRATKDAADRRVATLAERAAAAVRDHAARSQALDLARADSADETLDARVDDAAAVVGEATQARAAAEAALAAADPEVVALELRRAEGTERAIRADLDTLQRTRRDLEVELRALGRDGLGEQRAEVEEQLAASRRKLDAQNTSARAARLLHDTLAQAQRETRDRWLGPVRERAAPYLRLVQPDSDIVLNEGTLEIEGLLRKGVSEPFAGLSVGAREQVAVITRLALADILQGAKRPSAIILDDALVNTDEDRLHRMHLVLQRAGQTMQVLILTCRERDFVQLGAPIKRL